MSNDNKDIKEIKETDNKVKNITISDDDLQIYKDFIEEFKNVVPVLEEKTVTKNTDNNRKALGDFLALLEEINESIFLVTEHLKETFPTLYDDDEEEEDEDDIEVEVGCCEYVLTRGKNKGSICGVMCAPNSKMCKKHTKNEQKDK